MLEFVKSNAGLFWIFSIAFVFQVVGAILVISDVIRVNRLAVKYQGKIDQATTDYEQRTTPDALRAEARETARSEADAAFRLPFLAQRRDTAYVYELTKHLSDYQADKEERPSWLTWLGPVTLVLGICIGFAGTMLSIR